MTKPFDVSKFRRNLTKSISGIGVGFNDPTDWISTGNYALNYLISGDFHKGVPLGKVTVFAGESGCLPATAHVRIREDGKVRDATVGDLRDLHADSVPVEIDTPDGFQKIGNWYNKGTLGMVRVSTQSCATVCAVNHLIQTADGEWVMAANLASGMTVQTVNGDETVLSVTYAPPEECYDFEVLHPNHRYYGDGIVSHNSGKSFICAGNIVKGAQEQGVFVVLIDSENALDEAWLQNLGVNTSEDHLLKLNMAMIDDVAKTIAEFMKEYKALPEEDRPKVLFVVDSLGMLLTPTDVDQFEKGDMKGDMGRKPKALTALVRNCVNMFGSYNVGMVCTNHTYASQNIFDPDDKISGGQGVIYASSIVVAMKKLKLKEDEDGNKISDVKGIRAACKIMKTRYSKPFEDVQVKIPYDRGMIATSGLLEFFEAKGLIKQQGNRMRYETKSGEEIIKYRKAWERNEDNCLHQVMDDFMGRTPPASDSSINSEPEPEEAHER